MKLLRNDPQSLGVGTVSVSPGGNGTSNVQITNEAYTLEQNDRLVIVTEFAASVTLCPNPLSGYPVTIVADGTTATVLGPILGGTQVITSGYTGTFVFSPETDMWSVSIGGIGGGDGALIDSLSLATPAQQAAQAPQTYYIDPANSWTGGNTWSASSVQFTVAGAGNASDNNPGTSAALPLRTIAGLLALFGTSTPTINGGVGNNMIVIFLSDQPDFTDPVRIGPVLNGASLNIIGTPKLIATGTITTFVPRTYTATFSGTLATAVANAGVVTMTGLAGLPLNPGGAITVSGGSVHAGTFTILSVLSSSSVTYTDASGTSSAGNVTWSVTTGTPDAITATVTPVGGSSAPVTNWAPYENYMIQDTVNNCTFWVSSIVVPNGSTAFVTPPMSTIVAGDMSTTTSHNGNIGAVPPGTTGIAYWVTRPGPITTLATDTINILQPCKVLLTKLQMDLSSYSAPGTIGQNGIVVQNVWSQAATSNVSFLYVEGTYFQQCRLDGGCVGNGGPFRTFQANNAFTIGGGGIGMNTRYYGGTVNFVTSNVIGNLFGITIDGDAIVGQIRPKLGQVLLGSVFLNGTLGVSGEAFAQDGSDSYLMNYNGGNSINFGQAKLWGPGKIVDNSGNKTWIVNTPTVIPLSQVTATNALLLTGLPTAALDGISANGGANVMSSVGTTFSGPSSGNISISASVSNVQTATATTTDQGGVTNVFVGQSITITGDTNPANNGTFRITASSSAATGTISYFNPQVGAVASASSPALFTISALFTANGIATTPLSALVSQLDAAAGASTTTAIRNPHTGSSIGLNGGIFATS